MLMNNISPFQKNYELLQTTTYMKETTLSIQDTVSASSTSNIFLEHKTGIFLYAISFVK